MLLAAQRVLLGGGGVTGLKPSVLGEGIVSSSTLPKSPRGSSKTGRGESEERRLPGHSVIVPGSAPHCFINKAVWFLVCYFSTEMEDV